MTSPSPDLQTLDPQAAPASPRGSTAALSGLSLPARLEAILYLKGRPLALAELAEIAGIDREEAELALITLMTDYAHRDTALEIHQDGQRYSLQLRDSLGDLVQSLLPVDLSTAALRTLATVALKKRILQSELVELRGSGAYDHIKELIAQNFIERKRQSEAAPTGSASARSSTAPSPSRPTTSIPGGATAPLPGRRPTPQRLSRPTATGRLHRVGQ